MRYKIFAHRTKRDNARVIVGEYPEAPTYEQVNKLRTLMLMRSEDFDYDSRLSVLCVNPDGSSENQADIDK